MILLQAATFDTRLGTPAVTSGTNAARRTGDDYLIVQFSQPIDETLTSEVERSGAEIVGYIPNHALLLHATSQEEATLSRRTPVQWIGLYAPAFKISPEIGHHAYADPVREADDHLWLTADVFARESIDEAAAAVRATGAEVLKVDTASFVRRLQVRALPEQIAAIAEIPSIQWIEEWPEITSRNNSNAWILQSNVLDMKPVWSHGIKGQGQIIGHIDGRLQKDSCYFLDPVDNTPGPNHRKIVAYRSSTGYGADNHGTHTAGTLAGDQEPVNGSVDNAGMAYQARISHSNRADITGFGNTPSNLAQYLQFAHDDGARVHTNSWGDDTSTQYTTWARDIDLFSRNNEDDLVGFAVTNAAILRTPENAKNCLAVGACRDTPDQDLHYAGGTGPTTDGRRKPEIFAPGLQTVSASTAPCGTATSTGTSMACPAIMGAAALVRQYYEDGWYPSGVANPLDAFAPTGALVKATLLNSTVDMTGVAGYPSNREGWGRLLLDDALYFFGDQRVLKVWDVRNADGLVTDDVVEYQIETHGAGSTRITLVFTDQPATVGASFTPVNDLDLEVTDGEVTYYGNAIVDGMSIATGEPDPLNTVEMVILPGFFPTTYTVRVRARQVVDDPQGYALVVTGDLDNPAAVAEASAPLRHLFLQPNPFAPGEAGKTPGMSIRFELATAGQTEVALHDVAGRKLRTLFQGRLVAGPQLCVWDGSGSGGTRLSSGTYFVRVIQAGREIGTRQAILLH
ncbi:MAG: S8 family serine peptidase [Candidatus Eisenbacteria bacterium]